MAKNNKQRTRLIVSGLLMTEQRHAQVGQAVKIALAHQLDGEIDGIAITFESEEQ